MKGERGHHTSTNARFNQFAGVHVRQLLPSALVLLCSASLPGKWTFIVPATPHHPHENLTSASRHASAVEACEAAAKSR